MADDEELTMHTLLLLGGLATATAMALRPRGRARGIRARWGGVATAHAADRTDGAAAGARPDEGQGDGGHRVDLVDDDGGRAQHETDLADDGGEDDAAARRRADRAGDQG